MRRGGLLGHRPEPAFTSRARLGQTEPRAIALVLLPGQIRRAGLLTSHHRRPRVPRSWSVAFGASLGTLVKRQADAPFELAVDARQHARDPAGLAMHVIQRPLVAGKQGEELH